MGNVEWKGHEEIKRICDFISEIKEEIGKPKMEYKSFEVDHEVYEEIETNFSERIQNPIANDCLNPVILKK